MNNVRTPEQVNFMTHSMCPVVHKVYKYEKKEDSINIAFDMKKCIILKNELVDAYSKNYQKGPRKLLCYSTTDIRDSIIQSI